MSDSYSDKLRFHIFQSRMSLGEIADKLQGFGFKTTKVHLSKLQNGKIPPASDKLNDALSTVLGIDPLDLKVAAYLKKIPVEILEKIQSVNIT